MNDEFFNFPVYGLSQQDKQLLINEELNNLNLHHAKCCDAYQLLLDSMKYDLEANSYDNQPFIAARIFKLRQLKSINEQQIFKTLTSSGTTSQQVSKIFLDARSAKDQSKVLSKIMQEFVGKQRLPMLLVDMPNLIKDKNAFSARGAGIQGLSFLGRNHTYALNNDMTLNFDAVEAFFTQHGHQKIIIFGFTFMLWQYFLLPLLKKGKQYDLQQSILFHSGGWKKLQQLAVSNSVFSQTCQQILGRCKIHNFYGMVEQTGTVYVECEKGFLHTPIFSDILIRDPVTLKPLQIGEQGLIQLLSVLPSSYPGQSLLTEDLGVIKGQDDCACGRKGRYFIVTERLLLAENRGCSDTFNDERIV